MYKNQKSYKKEEIKDYLIDSIGYSKEDLKGLNYTELLDLVENAEELQNFLD